MRFSLAFLVALALSGAVNVRSIPLRHTNELNEVLAEFVALVPVEEVQKIAMQYVEEDAEVQAVIEYVQSDAFKNLVEKVESIEDVINFYNYLQESGLNVYTLVNSLHEAIGLPPLVPGGLARNIRITGGVAGLIADVKAVLPLEDIKALYHKKLETSPAFAELVARLSSPRLQELVDALRANNEFQKILKFAKEHGVDVKAVTDLLTSMFGLEFPSRHTRSTQDLQDDLSDFLALVPVEEIQKIAMQYVEEDAEVQAVIEYVQTDAFKNLVEKVENIEDVINFYNYLQASGLDIFGLVNSLHEAIGLPPLVPGRLARNIRITGGVAGLIADIKAILPLEDIKALYHKKLETSPAFAELVDRLSSPRLQELVDALRANDEFQKILKFAKEHGVDVKAITDLLSSMLGLEFPSRHTRSTQDLQDDLSDFLALVPVEEIQKIAMQYVEEDAEVQAVIEYVQTDAFKNLVEKVENIEDVINFYNYLQASGLDIFGLVNSLHEAIGLPPLVPGRLARNIRITGGVAGLIADIKAILPLEDIKALYHKKLETSPAFAELVDRLSSPRLQELVDALRANDEFQKILKFAKEHGVDVKAITDLLSSMLGLEFPSRHTRSTQDLQDDLSDFLALVPVDEIQKIAMQYVEEDAEVQAVIEYVQTDAFKNLVEKVENIEDVINFYNYLQASGLDIFGLVNSLHEAIGLPPLVPGRLARNIRITGGVAGLIADIKAILPLEDIKALYHKKLETSPAFAELVDRLSSPRLQELVDALRANDEFQKILKFAKEHGVDVKAITDLLGSMLGLEFPSRLTRSTQDLQDDLNDFLALVPVEEIQKIAMQYVEEDAEVQAVIEYVQTDAFRNLVKKVESIEDVINFYNYVQESGLNIFGLVNSLHEVIGLPPLVPGASARSIRITGGIAGLIADVKAVLPLEDIKALYHKKLETSPAFAELVERFSSPRFQQLINALRANDEFKNILAFAKEHGVDVKAVTDLLTSMFGLEFPSKYSRSTRDLQDDINDFAAILPLAEIAEIALEYYYNDPEIQQVYEYMQSNAFRQLVQEIEAMKEARDVLAFLQESGLNVYETLNMVHEIFGIPPYQPAVNSRKSIAKITGGVAGYVADIKAILPMEEIKALYYKKLETSPAFVKLVERLSSQEFQNLVDAVLSKDEARFIIDKLKAHGLDLGAVADLFSTILGLHFPKPVMASIARGNLNDDLQDFLALLPINEITEIVLDYLENDKEILETVEYLQSADFRKIVEEVEAMKEARNVLAFLEESGLNAYEFLNSIHEILGIPPFQPYAVYNKRAFKATGGLAGLIADIKSILPLEEIKALYYYKLENSPSFIKLINRLSSPEFQDFVDAVLAKEEVRVILGKLKEHGINLEAVTGLLSEILGLHFPKPVFHVGLARVHGNEELLKDLDDFIAILPMQEIFDIAVDYVFNDPEVQAAAVYVKSAEFRQIAIPAEQNREFRRFMNYLDNSGLPASFYMNKVNKYLGLPQIVPAPLMRSKRSGGGVRGMLNAIEAVLPHEEIKKLFEYKKQNSKAFSYMVERLEAQEFQDIVDELSLNEDFRTLGIQAASYGINLDSIINFFYKAFGIVVSNKPQRSARSLDDDLKEFVALIPEKKIRRIVTRYYLFDKEFKAAVVYCKSEEFAQLIRDLHEIPEYNDLLKSLEGAGLDVQAYIAKIHNSIGFEGFRFSRQERKTHGVAGFIAEIKAVLPIADIKALYKYKLETSKDFAGLVELISSDKFQAVTNTLFANEIFQNILHRLQGHGIDLKVVSDFFFAIFGITTPPGIIDFFARL